MSALVVFSVTSFASQLDSVCYVRSMLHSTLMTSVFV